MRERLLVFYHMDVAFTPDPASLTLVHHYEGQSGAGDDGNVPLYIIVIVAVAAGLSALSAIVAVVSTCFVHTISTTCYCGCDHYLIVFHRSHLVDISLPICYMSMSICRASNIS